MAKGNSFDDALTDEQQAFLKQGRAMPTAKNSKSKSQPKKKEPLMNRSALKQPAEPRPEPISPVPTPALVTTSNLSVRIDSRIAATILRAMTERHIERRTPSTQQDIVAEAMVDWLKKHGYMK